MLNRAEEVEHLVLADCHIVGSRPVIEGAPQDPKFARSTGLTLTFSRCYSESGGGLSCVELLLKVQGYSPGTALWRSRSKLVSQRYELEFGLGSLQLQYDDLVS